MTRSWRCFVCAQVQCQSSFEFLATLKVMPALLRRLQVRLRWFVPCTSAGLGPRSRGIDTTST